MNGDLPNIADDRSTVMGHPPFGDDAIGGKSALHACGLTIEIRIVAIDDHAQLFKIEIGVSRFQRVEGPLDPANATFYCILALGEFEPRSNAFAPVAGRHGE